MRPKLHVCLAIAAPLLCASVVHADPEALRSSVSQPASTPPSASPSPSAPAATVAAPAPEREHPNPRLKLSYRRFSLNNLDNTPVWLDGAQLDMYPLSRRWVRLGVELEGGAGHADLMGQGASLGYGLVGATAGFQWPARVTPFVEGRFAGGLLGGQIDGAIPVGSGVTVQGGSAVTWMYGGGIDAGIELYAVGRGYVSASIGWVRTTWHGVDMAAMTANPTGGMKYKDIVGDSFTFKIGLGI